MTSRYFTQGGRERYLQKYRSSPKRFYCYLLVIPTDGVAKAGRTCRLSYRMRNLSAAIYRDHELYLIECGTSQESLKLEKYLKTQLKHKHIRGEWFHTTRPTDVQSLLVGEFGHLLLVPHKAEAAPPASKPNEPPQFNITLC
jgi:hypothetical protein